MILCRPPRAALRPFVAILWAKEASPPTVPGASRELMLPTGAMHVAIRLGNSPLRLLASPDDPEGQLIGACVLNGVRSSAYCKVVADPAPSVGAMLRPGAADLLSNTPAGALSGRYTRLEDLWRPADLAELRERLESAPSLGQRLLLLEDILASRLPVLHGIDPLVAQALNCFDAGAAVGDVVAESGFSHRHIVRTFTEAVGVAPKTYLRLMRFNKTLEHLHGAPDESLADIAAAEGYADQAHMTREFQAFGSLTPGQYRRIAPAAAHHVPLIT
jgi:AraC-like DNA-binding protein